jgi:hypothetical protein
MEADDRSLWEGRARSFTSWLKAQARAARILDSTLWRYLKAGRVYQQWRLKRRSLQPLRDARTSTPETIELVDKISRCAPTSVTRQLIGRAANGRITNREARQIWRVYRTALGDRSQRGRGATEAPVVDDKLVAIGTMLRAIQDAGAAWIRKDVDPGCFELVTDVRLPAGRLPAIVILSSPDSGVQLHGILVALEAQDLLSATKQCSAMRTLVEHLWVAVPSKLTVLTIRRCHKDLGVLTVDGATVEARRRPTKNRTSGLFEKILLARMCGWEGA